jgi:hypothetical protein
MAIPRGVEMMVKSLIGMLGLDPQQMMFAVEDIRKSLHNAAADMATIRRQNFAIMAHLGIADPLTETDNNGQLEHHGLNGSGSGGSH